MKKLLPALLLLVFSGKNFAQTFTLINDDTVAVGAPLSQFGCYDTLVNNSATGYYIDAVRVINDTAPGWETSFCLDVCYPSFVDSARVYILGSNTQPIIFDFIAASPDTSAALMKFKNVSNPSNTVYQWFYGIADPTFGLSNTSVQKVNVLFYPVPALSNSTITLGISGNQEDAFVLNVFDAQGRHAFQKQDLKAGINPIHFSLIPGIYFYSLSAKGTTQSNGKLVITR
jgi:hypothetical protein